MNTLPTHEQAQAASLFRQVKQLNQIQNFKKFADDLHNLMYLGVTNKRYNPADQETRDVMMGVQALYEFLVKADDLLDC